MAVQFEVDPDQFSDVLLVVDDKHLGHGARLPIRHRRSRHSRHPIQWLANLVKRGKRIGARPYKVEESSTPFGLHGANERLALFVLFQLGLQAVTDFVLIAWETFKAAEFPFDEARRLALATGGLDVDELAQARIVEKKSGSVVLLPPEKRVRRGDDERLPGVRPDSTTFTSVIDAVHTVMYVASVDGLPAARALIDRAGLATDPRFMACVQGLVNAIPRARMKAGWVRKEAEILDRICAAYFPAIQIPPDPEMAEVLDLGL